jgi:hypothetical protein
VILKTHPWQILKDRWQRQMTAMRENSHLGCYMWIRGEYEEFANYGRVVVVVVARWGIGLVEERTIIWPDDVVCAGVDEFDIAPEHICSDFPQCSMSECKLLLALPIKIVCDLLQELVG